MPVPCATCGSTPWVCMRDANYFNEPRRFICCPNEQCTKHSIEIIGQPRWKAVELWDLRQSQIQLEVTLVWPAPARWGVV